MSTAYTLTLGDVRNDQLIRDVSGCCHDSNLFAAQVNAVTRRLMRRGGWWQTEVLMDICFPGCRVVWPRQVGTVLGVRFCRHGALQIKNNWWAVYGYKGCNDRWGGRWTSDAVMRDDDTAPCFNEITGNTGMYLRWNVVKRPDVGKTMRVFGTQYGGQPLQERDANNNWIPGITITAAAPYAQTSVLVTKITSIIIEGGMQGMSYLYQVDPSSGDLLMLGEYQPGETNPSYRVSHIENVCSICAKKDAYGREMRYGTALVKLAFIPALTDDDWVLLSNLDALRLGIQALRLEQANDDVQAEIKWRKSIAELNMEIRDRDPALQTVVVTNDFGSYCPVTNPI